MPNHRKGDRRSDPLAHRILSGLARFCTWNDRREINVILLLPDPSES